MRCSRQRLQAMGLCFIAPSVCNCCLVNKRLSFQVPGTVRAHGKEGSIHGDSRISMAESLMMGKALLQALTLGTASWTGQSPGSASHNAAHVNTVALPAVDMLQSSTLAVTKTVRLPDLSCRPLRAATQ